MHNTLIFVFGTLKQGFCNHAVNRGERFGGRFVTCLPHPLYIVGALYLPWLLDRPGQGLSVVGEVYRVDEDALAEMDRLERIDTPGWYERRRIAVRAESGGGETIEPWVYFGSEAGFAGEPVHAGPLAEYLLEHQSRWPVAE